jgi:cyclohexadieny/prephenate dehydrogenase
VKTPVFQRMAVIGFGLIGSSVARAARATKAAGEVVAFDSDPGVRNQALALGLADRTESELAAAVTGADLVVLATPVGVIGEVARLVAPHLEPNCVLTDVGSCKGVVEAAFAGLGRDDIHPIPGHPVAGTERSGPEAGFAELFHNRWVILCPQTGGDPDALDRLSAFWTALGARVEHMDAKHHDLVLAVTSHLPHLIAYNIVGTAADMETVTEAEVMKFSAGGFRDFTRIAASDPTMWRDVFLNNKGAVLEILARFTEDLHMLSRAIRWGEGEKLHELFTRTREIRRGVIALGQETPEANFGRDRK